MAGSEPLAIAVGDYNGDGKQDIAVADSSKTASILFGNGDNTFKIQVISALDGLTPTSIINRDFNEDGVPDLAVSGYSYYWGGSISTIILLIGKGDGTFVKKYTEAGRLNPIVVDTNKDGKLDLITFSDTATVYLGDGNGQFQKGQTLEGFGVARAVAVGDLNNDGIMDILYLPSSDYDSLEIWLGQGDGTFRQGTSIGGWKDARSIDIGDIDGDGIADIALSDYKNLHVIFGNGSGAFPGESTLYGRLYNGYREMGVYMATADFNADHNQDIVVNMGLPFEANKIAIYWGTGYNTFTLGPVLDIPGYFGGPVYTDDLNKDGLPDIMFAQHSWDGNAILTFFNNGDGTFKEVVSYNIGPTRWWPIFEDINKDGHRDIVTIEEKTISVWNYSYSIVIHTGKGDGTFQYFQTVPLESEPGGMVVQDFNGDGFTELAVSKGLGNIVGIYINNGDGTFSSLNTTVAGTPMIADDFNHDDKMDLIVIDGLADAISLLIGKGDGTFEAAQYYSAGYWAFGKMVSSDFNQDGRQDIAIAYGNTTGYLDLIFNTHPPLRTPPSPPTKLSIKAGDSAVSLSWIANTETDLAGYNVYRSLSAGGGYIKLNGTTVSSPAYTDTSATNGITYYYTVSAVDSEGEESSYAQKVTAVPSLPDTIPPVVKITTPASDETVITPALFVSGTINETDSKITVNGISGTIQKSDNTFTAYDIPLSAGENIITVTAVDAAGNSSSDSIKVVYVPTASISGVVKDEFAGQPVQWVSVYATDSEKTQSLSTGSDGSYFFGKLVPGEVTIKAEAHKYDTFIEKKTLFSGEAMNFDILMPLMPATLKGTVYNASTNRGIAGVTVTVTDRKKSQSVTTDSGGSYEVTNITLYDTTVTVSKEGYETYTEDRNFPTWYAYWGYFYLTALPPSAPVGLTAIAGGGYITLAWNQSLEDLDGYNIYRSTTSGSGYIKVNSSPVNSLSYKDLNVSTGSTYYFVITAVNTSQMESGYSSEIPAMPMPVSAPTGLTATAGAGYVDLSWSPSSDSDISYYNIYRSTSSGSGYVLLNTSTTITYKDTAVTAGINYFYIVTVVNTSLKESGYSNEVSAIPEQVIITAPTGLKATSGTGYVQLTWNKNPESDISYYNIYRKASSDKGYTKLISTGATSYNDSSVAGGTTYYYVITAVNTSQIESGYSTEASATPEQVVITAPTGLTAMAGGGYVELSWRQNPERDISGYNIYRRTESERGYTKLASASKTSYTDSSVTADTTYYYVITAVNTSGTESGYSSEASATPTESTGSITVISPADGATLTASSTTVTGMVITSKEIGLAIDVTGQSGTVRYLAEVNNGYFAAMIALEEGTNTIKAIATDTSGNTEEKSITINATATTEAVTITANPESGIPATKADGTTSFDVTLTADTSVSDTVTYSWDIEGDGRADQEGVGLTEVTASYQTPGLYFPTLTVTDTQSNTYTATTIVNVLDRDEMDTLLKGKWEGMKGALGSGDIETAITAFEASSQETYTSQFTDLQSVLADISNDMRQINLVKVEDNYAEYEIIAARGGVTYSFYLLFVKDENGLWKIKVF